MTPVQIVLGVMTLGALVYTVLAYPNKYGALSGRSRLFRTVNVCLFDLLLLLGLLATFIDWHAGVSPRVAPLRALFYFASCLFLCLGLVCVAVLDALESYTVLRRERRTSLEQMLREQIEQARSDADASGASQKSEKPNTAPKDGPQNDA